MGPSETWVLPEGILIRSNTSLRYILVNVDGTNLCLLHRILIYGTTSRDIGSMIQTLLGFEASALRNIRRYSKLNAMLSAQQARGHVLSV